jgi:hypothetical protein
VTFYSSRLESLTRRHGSNLSFVQTISSRAGTASVSVHNLSPMPETQTVPSTGPISLKARNQSRSTAADAYYRPIVGKMRNFHLLTGQVVTKVRFDGKKRATSVDVSVIMGNYSCRLSSDFQTRLVRAAQHEQQQRSDQR